MTERRRGLGRGLGALIPPAPSDSDRPSDVFFPRPRPEQEAGHADGVTEDDGREATGQGAPAGRFTGNGAPPAPTTHGGSVAEGSDTEGRDTEGRDTEDPDALGPDTRGPDTRGPDTRGPDTREPDTTEESSLTPVPGARFAEIPVDQVRPNPRQPRQVFDDDELAELSHSIGEIGVLQPIVVRPVTGADGPYELVMGERRWRASQRAGMASIPAIIREVDESDLLRDALLENLHRTQLNPLEEAAAYRQLLDDFGCTQEELSGRIGRSRPQISNTLRLLRLPPLVQRRVASGVLSAGHARALLGLEDTAAMERLAQRIVAEGLSVRSVEEIVLLGQDDDAAPSRRPRRKATPDPELDTVAERLADRLDTRVSIAMGSRKGRLTVEFASREDLERILSLMADGRTG